LNCGRPASQASLGYPRMLEDHCNVVFTLPSPAGVAMKSKDANLSASYSL
jgi:hypothetical protein